MNAACLGVGSAHIEMAIMVLPGEEHQEERISKTLSTWLSQPAVEGAAAGFWPLADSQGLQQAILLIGSYLFTAKANGFH